MSLLNVTPLIPKTTIVSRSCRHQAPEISIKNLQRVFYNHYYRIAARAERHVYTGLKPHFDPVVLSSPWMLPPAGNVIEVHLNNTLVRRVLVSFLRTHANLTISERDIYVHTQYSNKKTLIVMYIPDTHGKPQRITLTTGLLVNKRPQWYPMMRTIRARGTWRYLAVGRNNPVYLDFIRIVTLVFKPRLSYDEHVPVRTE